MRSKQNVEMHNMTISSDFSEYSDIEYLLFVDKSFLSRIPVLCIKYPNSLLMYPTGIKPATPNVRCTMYHND